MKKIIAIAFGAAVLAAPVAADDLGGTLGDITDHVMMLTLNEASPVNGSNGEGNGYENGFEDTAVVPLPAAGFLLLGGLGGLALLRRRTRA